MPINLPQLEAFFDCKFEPTDDTLHEMCFIAGDMHHLIWVDDVRNVCFFKLDSTTIHVAFPAVEFGFKCSHVEETNAGPFTPVLLFYDGEEIRLAITKTKNGKFSFSPNWNYNSDTLYTKHG